MTSNHFTPNLPDDAPAVDVDGDPRFVTARDMADADAEAQREADADAIEDAEWAREREWLARERHDEWYL